MGMLHGKVAIVTGASAGIGRATAFTFAREGAKLVLADIDLARGQETEQLLKGEGAEVVFVRTDVSEDRSVATLVQSAVETFGRLDCAFNNAGIEGVQAPTAETSEENWDRVLGINLKGVWRCMRHEIPAMLDSGGGAIVNTASVAGLVGFPNLPAYVASKHAVVGLTKTAALEYATTGIRVNAVCPGVIHTEMIDRITGDDPEVQAQFTALEPIGRMGAPEEVAEAVAYLCSEAASFVTGHAMVVDGGFVAA